MNEKISAIVNLFAENEDAEATLKAAQTMEEAVAILCRYGIELTIEEFIQIGKELNSDELSEEMLIMVAGGGPKMDKFKQAVKDFFRGFVTAL